MNKENKRMKDLTIYRSDFRNSQDSPHESLFECILKDLGIPEEKWDDIDEVIIKGIMSDDIETD